MPDINVNVNDQQNVINASAGIYPTLLVDVDHEENTVSVTVEKQTPVVDVQVIGRGPVGPQGIQGPPGADGADGQDGAPGADGADGVSPVISSESITGGHRLTIVDAGGTTTVDVMDGQDGADGNDGADGVSPEVTIASITGGHSVTITDADHPGGQTFNVLDGIDGQNGQDGQDGQDGVGVPASGSAGQVLAKKSGTDYDTEWVTPSAGSNDVEWVTYGSTTSATIETAYQAGKIVAVLSGDRVHYLQKRNSSTDHLFYAAIDTRFYVCRCTSNSWSNYYYECLELGDTGTIPSGGNAGQLLAKNSATDYDVHWVNKTQDYPSAYCTTAAGTAAKKASCSLWTDTANSYLHVLIGQANTNAGAITMNVNSTGAKPIYINGEASSATNYTLPAGSYIAFYDGTNFYFRTDGKLTADITGTADGVTVPQAATAAPADLGTAAVGSSTKFALEDHVHKMPSASDVGALPSGTTASDIGALPNTTTAADINGMSKWVKLWENASPTSSFSPQTLTLNLQEYEFIMIVFNHWGYNSKYNAAICRKNLSGRLLSFDWTLIYREYTVSASGIDFDVGKVVSTYGSSSGVTTDNQSAIPVFIYGIKGVE